MFRRRLRRIRDIFLDADFADDAEFNIFLDADCADYAEGSRDITTGLKNLTLDL